MAVHVEIKAEHVSGAGVLLQPLRLAPMLFMAGVLTVAATVVAVAIGVTVLVTGSVPSRLAAFQIRAIRQRVRTFSGFFFLRSDTPPWPSARSTDEPGDDPVVAVIVDVPTELARSALFSHAARAVGHLLVLIPLAVLLDLLYPFWIVHVVRGGWSDRAQARLVVAEQWTADVLAHAWLVSAAAPRWRWAELISRHPQQALS